MSKRYLNIKKHLGVRKDVVTGRYQALKKIRGVQYAETFDSIREAQLWRNTFNGETSLVPNRTTSTLGYVWERMKVLHFPCLEKTTQRIWDRRFVHLTEMSNMHMEEITSTVLNRWIERKKKGFSDR